jgi:hypothetical protein
VANLARRLAGELLDVLEFTAREVSRGLSHGTQRVATEVDKAATAFADAERKLAREARGLHGDESGVPSFPRPGHPRMPGEPEHVAAPAGHATHAHPTADRPAHVDPVRVPPTFRPGPIPTHGPAADLVPEGYRPYGNLSEQEFYEKFLVGRPPRWRYPKDDGFADGVSWPNSLRPGDVLDRFGGTQGTFASPAGVGFEQRALPPSSLAEPYHRYVVTKKGLPDTISEGLAAPAFAQPGGGVQLKFDRPIQWYLDNGYLEELE